MNGRIVAGALVATAVFGGAAMYVLQVYVHVGRIPAEEVEIRLTSLATGQAEAIPVDNVEAIDGASSPLKFRACFDARLGLDELEERYAVADDAAPLVPPRWFRCFDARAIGAALEAGQATAFLSEAGIRDGVDRIVAIFGDGRGYAWHQLNGKYAEQGTVIRGSTR